MSFAVLAASLLFWKMDAYAASTDVWVESSYVNVFQDSLKPEGAKTSIRIAAARNEFEAAQVILRSDQAFTINSETFTNLTSGSNVIDSSNLKYQFVEYEYLNSNSHCDNVIERGAGYYPDALSNATSISVAANKTQPIWIRAYIPKNIPAGIYTGTATIITSQGNYSVGITIDVKNVTLPDSNAGNFDCALWTQYCGPTSWYEPYDDMAIGFGVERYTPQWWAIVGDIAQKMKDYRNTTLTVNMCYLLMDGGTYKDSNGVYHFNWSKFDEVIQFFIDQGAVKRLEGVFIGQQQTSGRMMSEILDTNASGQTFRTYVYPGSAASNAWIDQFIPALRDHLDEKGWTDMWWMHIGDEPGDAQVIADYKYLANRVKAAWNRDDLKLGDAMFSYGAATQLVRYPNIWIPITDMFEQNRTFFTNRQALGEEVWFYNCSSPRGMNLNRGIDQPVWMQRATIWMAYKYGVTGYLHWGFNAWHYNLDEQYVKGDGWIVKPDKPNLKLKLTIRYESLRDGIEDYELFKIAEQVNPGITKGIADSLISSGTRYTRDTDYMMRLRENLLNAAAGTAVFSPDRAYNKNVTASSQTTGYEAAKAVDNNPATSWKSSAGGTQWIQVDLGAQYKLDGIRLKWDVPYATNYKIQTSYDGSIWSDIVTATSGSGGDFFGVRNCKARYIRIYCTSSSGSHYALKSIEVGGVQLERENLAGGRPYQKPSPHSSYPDSTGRESTDGIIAGCFEDGKSYAYMIPQGGVIGPEIVVDLGSVKTVGEVKIHGYEKYEWDYRVQSLLVLTSVDGVNYTRKGSLWYPNGEDGIWYNITFPATLARYVKVIFYKIFIAVGFTHDWLFIDEIEVYAPPAAEMNNFAHGRPYVKPENPHSSYPDSNNAESTDGIISGDHDDGYSYGYHVGSAGQQKTVSITVDLGSNKTVNLAALRKYEHLPKTYMPDKVKVYTSTNGTSFTLKGETAYANGLWYKIPFADTTARYVRFEVTKKSTGLEGDWMFINEIAVYGDPSTSTYNVAAGNPYTKSMQPSSQYPDSGNAESTNGILAGAYHDGRSYGYSIPSGQSITVDITIDLGTNRTINLVKFLKYNGTNHNYAPDKITVFTSTDGTNFTQKGQSTSAVNNWFEVSFADTSARYVRVRAEKTYGYYADWLFIDEIEVYGI